MGDKSPKSKSKNSTQKKSKTDSKVQKKQAADALKQVAPPKK